MRRPDRSELYEALGGVVLEVYEDMQRRRDQRMAGLVRVMEAAEAGQRQRDQVLGVWIEATFGPGSFWDDARRARRGDYAALERLATGHFSSGHVFHPRRWDSLRPYWHRRQHERGLGDRALWAEIAPPALCAALSEPPAEGETLGGLYRRTRRELRVAIERDLCDGLTLDARAEAAEPDLPEPDLPEDVLALAEVRLDVALALARLSERQREVLSALLAGEPDDGVAQRLGISAATVRWHRAEALQRLGESLA